MSLTEFLLARIAVDEAVAREAVRWNHGCRDWADAGEPDWVHISRWDPARVLAECEAKRRIVEFHKSWPVLVESPPNFTQDSGDDITTLTVRMSKQIAWLTEQEYRNRFGTEPPTAPMLRALAAIYADHSDYQQEWNV